MDLISYDQISLVSKVSFELFELYCFPPVDRTEKKSRLLFFFCWYFFQMHSMLLKRNQQHFFSFESGKRYAICITIYVTDWSVWDVIATSRLQAHRPRPWPCLQGPLHQPSRSGATAPTAKTLPWVSRLFFPEVRNQTVQIFCFLLIWTTHCTIMCRTLLGTVKYCLNKLRGTSRKSLCESSLNWMHSTQWSFAGEFYKSLRIWIVCWSGISLYLHHCSQAP